MSWRVGLVAGMSVFAAASACRAQEVPRSSVVPDTTMSFHRSLSDSSKHAVYLPLLRKAKGIVSEVWGEPCDWTKICGVEPDPPSNTLSLDPTIRLFRSDSVYEEPYPAGGLTQLLELKLVDKVCEAETGTHWCEDSTATLTAGISTIRPRQDATVEVTFRLMRRRPACPGDERMGGFAASFLVILARGDGGWEMRRTQLLRIT